MAGKRSRREEFGSPRQLPSGRFQARYTGPDGAKHKAPRTFDTLGRARGWLAEERKLIDLGTWTPPADRDKAAVSETVSEWMDRWLELKRPALRVSSFQTLARTVENRLTRVDGDAAALAALPLNAVTKDDVLAWWEAISCHFPDTERTNKEAYARLKAAFADAVELGKVPANPVAVKAARGKAKPKSKELPATADLHAIIAELPPRYQLGAVLCLFHGLRIGEMLAVERHHLVKRGEGWTVQVRGNLQRLDVDGRARMTWQPPKTKAGRRDVPLFAQFSDLVDEHLNRYCGPEGDALVTTTTTGKAVLDTSFRGSVARARQRAGVEANITPHHGRNWLITALAENGATPAEIGALLGQEDLRTITEIYMKARPESSAARMAAVGATLGAA
ncbi:tyrosine-type recombinase/integrase [Dietzia timorensis]|uniref:Integrase n=1 Tax=Dietzia timorensis TaxID=499555 RepID=A0A173LG20_9ACTN|nr:tyrosine-type recombinase/integrase [Dietzia timorensis]ANI91246.1 Integrase [Dietzia timorensis]